MKTIAILTVTLAGLLWTSQADAHDRFGHTRNQRGFYGPQIYGGFGDRRYHTHWHNTGHYDYVPGGYVRHFNHWHTVPGGYYWHDTSHPHFHRGHRHHR